MAWSRNQRIAGGVALTVAALGLASLSVRGLVDDGRKDFTKQDLSADTLRVIDAATKGLLAAAAGELPGRLREALSPNARPEAFDGLLATLQSMSEARQCVLVVADGFGPTLIKAIYDLTDADGQVRRLALLFERTKSGVVLLDVSL
jgi:hypothetical protein